MSIDSCNWQANFTCMVAVEDLIIPNNYSLTIHFSVKTSDPALQNLAFERLKFWVLQVLNNSIIIHDQHSNYVNFLKQLSNNFVDLPVDPADYYLVQAIWTKLNKITDGHLEVSVIELASELSDGVNFVADGSEAFILDQEGVLAKHQWWNSPTPKTNLHQDYSPWKQFGLDFNQEPLTKTKKSARIIRVKNFNPTLVKNSEN